MPMKWPIIFALIATQAQAVDCFPRDVAADALGQSGLQPIFAGLNQEGVVTEIWIAPDGRWIELVSGANGVSCIYGGGLSSGLFAVGAPA